MAEANVKVKVRTEMIGYDGAGFWRRLVLGLTMEPKNGGAWHGSIGRTCVWVFLGLCVTFEVAIEAGPPGWTTTGLWSALAYATGTKFAGALQAGLAARKSD